MSTEHLVRDLERDEGYRAEPYRDSLGIWTVAIGRNLEANPLTVAYRFGSGRSAVRERHCSNAGQTPDNKGLDMALYGRRL